MKLIKEIYEGDLDLEDIKPDFVQTKVGKQAGERYYRLRKAARALIFQENKIAMLNAAKLYLHKLPGGGIEENESIAEGLYREILEETGCSVAETRELGIVVEYRDTIELLQISYVFTGNVQDDAGTPSFTKKEQDEGFRLEWFDPAEAIKIMKNEDSPNTYAGKFIHARDLAILEYYTACYEGKEGYKKES